MKRALLVLVLVPAVSLAQWLSGTVKTTDPVLSLNASQSAYSVFDAMVASSDLAAADEGLVVVVANVDDDKDVECRPEVNGTAQGWFPIYPKGEGLAPTFLSTSGLKVGAITDVICRTTGCTIAGDCGAVSLFVSVTVAP